MGRVRQGRTVSLVEARGRCVRVSRFARAAQRLHGLFVDESRSSSAASGSNDRIHLLRVSDEGHQDGADIVNVVVGRAGHKARRWGRGSCHPVGERRKASGAKLPGHQQEQRDRQACGEGLLELHLDLGSVGDHPAESPRFVRDHIVSYFPERAAGVVDP